MTVFCECGCGEPVKPGRRFVDPHQNRANGSKAPATRTDRYTVEDMGHETPCWLWSGPLHVGYGRFRIGGRLTLAHRWHYEQANGPIPEGLDLDHLCRNRACVNPDHLEPVTRYENILRGEGAGAKYSRRTHCAFGHPLSGANLYVRPNGARTCRTCKRERWAR